MRAPASTTDDADELSTLIYGSYLGGSGDADTVRSVSADGLRVVAGGVTTSGDFPTTTTAFQPTFGGGSEWDGFIAVSPY